MKQAALKVRLQQSQPIALQVNLHCKPGEMLALTGPSGSGKTTVLRAIAGLRRVEKAYIECNGQCWADSDKGIHRPVQLRSSGFMFQDYALFPHLTAAQNVMLAMQHRPRHERRQHAHRILAQTNMQGLESRKPAALSGGQRQRVALARALARDPAVLLLDEPFAAVDQQTRRKLYRELSQLRRDLKLPIVLVTHDINEVQQLADSLCLIHRGHTLQSGPVDEVLQQPASREIARLLGFQNLFSATLVDHDADHSHYRVGRILISGPRSDIPEGSKVCLLISAAGIVLHRGDKPSRGEVENPIDGTVSDAVALGDDLSLRLRLNDIEKSLRFRVSRHVAKRNAIDAGSAITVSIMTDAIHVMTDL